MIALLRQRNFGLLWSAGLLALIGDWAFYGAMPIFVLDQTDSIFLSGITWTLIGIPQIFIGPFAGVLVDRIDRKRIMLFGTLTQALAAGALLVAGNTFGIWFAMAVLLAQAVIFAIWSPAESAILPTVVTEPELITANALNALNDNFARIIGPFLGALLYTWIDIRGIALVNATVYVLAAVLIGLVVAPGIERVSDSEPHESMVASMRIALGHIRSSRLLKTMFLVTALVGIADGPLTASLAPYIRLTLERSAEDFGLFLSMRGVAGIFGGLLIGAFATKFRQERLLILSLFIIGMEILALGIVRNFWLIIIMMVAAGPVFIALNTVVPTFLQRGSEDAWRGRLFAFYGAMAATIFVVATFIGSVLADLLTPPIVIVGSGILYILAGAAAMVLLPGAVRHLDPPSEIHTA